MNNKQGWVSIYRKLFEHPIFIKHPEWIAPFIYMICLAEYKGELRGCLFTTRRKLAQKFHLTEGNIITMFRNLCKDNMLEVLSKNDPRMIQDLSKYLIVNYDSYQNNDPRMIQDLSKNDPKDQSYNLNYNNKYNNINKGMAINSENYDIVVDISKWFYDLLPDQKKLRVMPIDRDNWKTTFIELIETYQYKPDQIRKICFFARTDDNFWKNHFFDPSTLTEKKNGKGEMLIQKIENSMGKTNINNGLSHLKNVRDTNEYKNG